MRSAITLGLACLSLAIGQPKNQQAILDYPLTVQRANQLISAMESMTKYVASLPDFQERLKASLTMTPAEQLAQIEKDPKAAAILKENNLTAREYIVGVPALRMALLAAQGASSPNIVASPANVAFAKAHLSELKPRMDAADGIRPRK
jgi:hypothetical protein